MQIEKIEKIIKNRLKEFETLGSDGFVTFSFFPFLNLKVKATIQSELAFCISTANSSAISGLHFQKSLEGVNLNNLSMLQHKEIEERLKKAGVRFYRRKALYIRNALASFDVINRTLDDDRKARDKLVKAVKGFGYKEASHFLRNIGRKNVAIVDRHILKWLCENGLIEYPKSLSRKNYLKIEKILEDLSLEKDMSLAELDLYLWYEKTKKVLK